MRQQLCDAVGTRKGTSGEQKRSVLGDTFGWFLSSTQLCPGDQVVQDSTQASVCALLPLEQSPQHTGHSCFGGLVSQPGFSNTELWAEKCATAQGHRGSGTSSRGHVMPRGASHMHSMRSNHLSSLLTLFLILLFYLGFLSHSCLTPGSVHRITPGSNFRGL